MLSTRASPRRTDRYLLPYEQAAIEVHRHWMILMPPVLKSLAILTVGFFVVSRNPYSTELRNIVTLIAVGVVAYLGYQFLQWRMDHFIVTNRRVLLVSGVLTKRTAVMPLLKVTDMTFEQNPLARMLHYGTFVFESAGQDQALSRVTHLPGGPRQLYRQISELLFANYAGARTPAAPQFIEPATVNLRTGQAVGESVRTHQTTPIAHVGPLWEGDD